MIESYTSILQRKRRQDESPPRPQRENQGPDGRRSRPRGDQEGRRSKDRTRTDQEYRRSRDRDRMDSNIRNTTVTGRGYEETMKTIREYTDQERDRDRNQDRERDRDRLKDTKKFYRT